MRTYDQIMQPAIETAIRDARVELMDGLAQLTKDQQAFFKRMYSHDDLSIHIDEVVHKMPASKLDWAMQQVQRTLSNMLEAKDDIISA